MEDDHDLDLQIFRNNPNCNWEVSSSYKQPSLSPAPQLPQAAATFSSPLYPHSPTPQLLMS